MSGVVGNTIQSNNTIQQSNETIEPNDIDKLYSNFKDFIPILIGIIIVISSIVYLIIFLIAKQLFINNIVAVVFVVIVSVAVISILVSYINDYFLGLTRGVFSSILLPKELNDENNTNIKILLNIVLIYSLDYIYKKKIDNKDCLIAYKKKREISAYKNSLNNKFAELSKIYLDIISEEVNKIKEKEQKKFERENLQKNIDKDILISDNNINKDNTHFAVSTVIKISSKIGNILGSISNFSIATITATLRELWRSMVNKWSRPFAGFVLLILVISLIIGMVMGSQGGGGGGGVGGGNLLGGGFIGGANNMNSNKKTDILSVIQRLPENIFSFIDNIILAYTRFTEFVNNSSDIINEISSEFSNTVPEVSNREEHSENDGLYDNIYTFDYNYLHKISVNNDDISTGFTPPPDKNSYVYNLIQPNSNIQISKYYNMNHDNNISSIQNTGITEYIYRLKCTDDNITDSNCKLKTIPDSYCSNINYYKEDTTDYKNIII
jgi:uncharacterized membrane protein YgcG